MKGTIKIEFEGNNCLNCPFCHYNSMNDAYYCKTSKRKEKFRMIEQYVEYPSELGPRPDWCPIIIEEE